MDTAEFLKSIRESIHYRGQIAHVSHLPARPARYASPRHPPSDYLLNRVRAQGIEQLYSHQAEAIDAVAEGRNVVLVTSTASGKTLAYNLPVLNELVANPRSRAFYLFPTKALAQDQLGKLHDLDLVPSIRFATYDGDTPRGDRPAIRRSANIVLTNPDMLHIGILPNHQSWAHFFRGLQYVVVDEIHTYRGVFGAHVGNIIRRLRRIAEFHGGSPQFICCSATIGNPQELAEELTGLQCEVIDNDGSPKGPRAIALWNPPDIGDGERASANAEATSLLCSLVLSEVRSIAFARARITAELLLRYVRRQLEERGESAQTKVEAYRGGYTAEERREIERRLFDGDLLGVAATNALELGVDVGGLDAVLLNGYPGTVASFWQQVGRAGRARESALAILIAHSDPLEQFIIRHPELILGKAAEKVRANPANPYVLGAHLKCAAYERPISPTEMQQFGDNAVSVAETLESDGELVYRQGRWFHPFTRSPAAYVNIRSASNAVFHIVEAGSGRLMGDVERERAFEILHEGAVYLHRGAAFIVQELDLVGKHAFVDAVGEDLDYYTDAITNTTIEVNHVINERLVGEGSVAWGAVTVTTQTVGYFKRRLLSEEGLGYYDLDLPPQSFDTIATWIRLPNDGRRSGMNEEEAEELAALRAAGAHGLEHVAGAMVPMLVACDRNDVGSAWYSVHPYTLAPTVFVFDFAPGGVGLSEAVYQQADQWLEAVRRVLLECGCSDGCPGCVLSSRCPARNEGVSKAEAVRLLNRMLNGT